MLKQILMAVVVALSCVACVEVEVVDKRDDAPVEETPFVFDSVYHTDMMLTEATCGYGTIGTSIGVDLHIRETGDTFVVDMAFDGQGVSKLIGVRDGDGFVVTMNVVAGNQLVSNTLVGTNFSTNPSVELQQNITRGSEQCYQLSTGVAQ